MGLYAALGLLLEVGIAAIAADLTAKRTGLAAALQAKGYEVFFPEGQQTGGITSCWREGTDMKAVGERLAAEKKAEEELLAAEKKVEDPEKAWSQSLPELKFVFYEFN